MQGGTDAIESLETFLRQLDARGRVVFGSPPPAPEGGRGWAEAAPILARRFEDDALDLAGGAPPFVPRVACWGAEIVRQACWLVACRDEPPESVARRLPDGPRPQGPGCHASADLMLRHLPTILRRAERIDGEDPLARRLAAILAEWPLSGILAGLDEPPARPCDFGHEGLAQRYAERWSRAPKAAWLPPEGAARAWIDLIRRSEAT
jgi:hypothetical protein